MRCSVYGCHSDNQSKNYDKNIRFYTFPKDVTLQESWVIACGRADKVNVKTARVCSKHFVEEDFKRNLQHELLNYLPKKGKALMKNEVVPSLLLPTSSNWEGTRQLSTKRNRRKKMGDIPLEEDPLKICTDVNREETRASSNILAQRSKELYEGAYKRFQKYMQEKHMDTVTENLMLDFMVELSKKFKSSSLWSNYSMLRGTLNSLHNVDISKFMKVRAFLKQQRVGYRAKKSKSFTKYELNKFLSAPDDKYLIHKVIFIFGISGACSLKELTYLTTDNIEDLGKAILIKIPTKKKNKRRSFMVTGKYLEFYRKYTSLRPNDVNDKRFFWRYYDGRCTRQVVGLHKFESILQEIAAYLKLPNAKDYTGRCFRSVSPTFLDDGTLIPPDDDSMSSDMNLSSISESDFRADTTYSTNSDTDHTDSVNVHFPKCELGEVSSSNNVSSPRNDESSESRLFCINDCVEIKTEPDDEMSNASSASSSNSAENANLSDIINLGSKTVDLDSMNSPIIIENCRNCTFNIS